MLKNWIELTNKIIVFISIALFLLVFITGIKIPVFWLVCAVLIAGSVITIIKEKQLNAIIIVSSSLLAIHFMTKIVSAYARISPDLIDSALILARGLGLLFVIVTAIILIIYNRSPSKEKTSNLVNGITDITDKIAKKSSSKKAGNEIVHNSVYLCQDSQNENNEIILPGKDRYLHTLLIGSTGTGKTTTVLAPMVWQDLWSYYQGNPLGITIVAPDHEFCYQVRDWCQTLGIPYNIIDLDSPDTSKFNPLEGDSLIVSEIMRTVLRSTFGEQEAFFAQAQEQHAKNTMLLLKKLRGDNLTLFDVYQALMDIEEVQGLVDQYVDLYGEDVVTTYFKKEAFGRNKDKLHQFAMGLRLQISDLLANDTVYNVLVGRSDINLDRHMSEGGVLLINTAQGKMGRLSRVFGQFIIMHIQNAVFRRPGDEFNRIPHFLYIDELPVYFNPELEDLLNRGRKYRCACVFTIQGPSQLERGKSQGESMRDVVINGCRNKIVIGIESSDDAQLLSELFGEEENIEIRKTRKRFTLLAHTIQETTKDKPRFTYTDVMELKPWHGIVKIVVNGKNQQPVLGKFEEPWIFLDKVSKQLSRIRRHRVSM